MKSGRAGMKFKPSSTVHAFSFIQQVFIEHQLCVHSEGPIGFWKISLFTFSSLLEEHLQDLCIREETRDTISPPTSPPDPAAPWYPLPLQLCPEDQDKMLLRVTRLGSRWLWWSFMFRNHQGFLVPSSSRHMHDRIVLPGPRWLCGTVQPDLASDLWTEVRFVISGPEHFIVKAGPTRTSHSFSSGTSAAPSAWGPVSTQSANVFCEPTVDVSRECKIGLCCFKPLRF